MHKYTYIKQFSKNYNIDPHRYYLLTDKTGNPFNCGTIIGWRLIEDLERNNYPNQKVILNDKGYFSEDDAIVDARNHPQDCKLKGLDRLLGR